MEEQLKSVQISPQPAPLSTRTCPSCNVEFSSGTAVCPNDGTVLVGGMLPKHYEITGEIGRGGMGVIYKAHQTLLDKIVAIKMLNIHDVKENSWMRFQQEARALANLRHPNIIMIHDFGVATDGRPYMVMDYVEGKTLAQLIAENGAVPLDQSLEIFMKICQAMMHAHGAGVLHRDLKPANIMVRDHNGETEVTVLDFGIAKVVSDDAQAHNLTQTGDLLGSPLYMSPEQCSGLKLERSSDVYSFGCIMYETLTGLPPITGDTALAVMFNQLNNMPCSLREASLGKEFPEDLEDLVCKTLAKDPASRYQTMDSLLDDLQSVKDSVESGGKASKSISKRTTSWAKPNSKWLGQSNIGTRYFSKGIIAYCAVTLLLIFLSGIFYWFTSSNHERLQTSAQHVDNQNNHSKPDRQALKQEAADATAREIIAASADKPKLDLKRITDNGLQGIENCQSLEKLDIQHSSLTASGLSRLRKLPLRDLSIRLSDINNGMAAIAQISTLKELTLKNTRFPISDLQNISALKNLEILDLSNTKVDGKGLALLAGLQALKTLYLTSDDIDDQALSQFPYLPSLRYLVLKQTRIRNRGLESLAKLPSLVDLDVSDTVFTDNSVPYLKHLKITNLTVRNNEWLTTQGVDQLCQLPAIRELRVEGCKNVNLKDFVQLQQKYPKVTFFLY
ncbi:hypothetical protein BH10CYA1_BH10CYA1_53200 [soil metagenome]